MFPTECSFDRKSTVEQNIAYVRLDLYVEGEREKEEGKKFGGKWRVTFWLCLHQFTTDCPDNIDQLIDI